jgi:RecG-like helicase
VSEAVLFMNGELGRGISLKMNNDAIVFVISSKNSFGLSQVKQMIGRGSRSFGKCIGYVFLVNVFAERMKG